MITAPDLAPLRTLLAPLSPEARRAFAVTCAVHVLDQLPADPRCVLLRAAVTMPGSATRETILNHPWGHHTHGHPRYLAWLACYWASWPLLALSTWVAEQAAFYGQWAVAELAERPGLYQLNAAAEARWQRAQLTTARDAALV